MKKTSLSDIILQVGEESVSFTTQDILVIVQGKYSRQHIVQIIKQLLLDKRLIKTGSTRSARYSLPHKAHFLFPSFRKSYLNKNLSEEEIFEEFQKKIPQITTLPNNAFRVLRYAFTEIVNNAIDHSSAKRIHISTTFLDAEVRVEVQDNGIGLFRNVMQKFGYGSELEALQQLAKGKLTTLPEYHSGQGIFFSTKATNHFEIDSYGYKYEVDNSRDDFAFLRSVHRVRGTKVSFIVKNHTSVVLKDIFLKYQTEGTGGPFDSTQIRVKLYAFGTDFVSRSEAKRVLERLEAFNSILLDFDKVEGIGQAFADQVFRVFANQHPEIELIPVNTNPVVQFMIDRTLSEKEK